MKELKENIKNKNFKNIYLFFGEEKFLKYKYAKDIRAAVTDDDDLMNYTEFEGKNTAVGDIKDAADTLPFMNQYRLIIIKDSGLFYSGRKNESEKMTEYVANIPENSIIVFIEDKVDKRGKLYKNVNKFGKCVEFNAPKENELIKWITDSSKKKNTEMKSETAVYFLRYVGGNMDNLNAELEKLTVYKGSGIIERKDIENICTKSTETKIFDMVEAIGRKDTSVAIKIYNNLLLYKESPIMILAMIARQFRIILQSKYLSKKGKGNEEIGTIIKQRSFVVRECINQGKNFRNETILAALKECYEYDRKIKRGEMEDKLAVEMIIMKYGSK